MTLFDAIKERVPAREAAEAYHLRFRGHRACCPWHNDNHPDLAFYENGTCYCHACHNGGDSVALTAQIFGLSMIEAAKKLNTDFSLGLDTVKPVSQIFRNQVERQRAIREKERDRDRREWELLCRVRHEANRQIEEAEKTVDRDQLWENQKFVRALTYRSRAEIDLDRVWEEKVVARYG